MKHTINFKWYATPEPGQAPVDIILDGAKIDPSADPVQIERDKVYELTVKCQNDTDEACWPRVKILFPHCESEYLNSYESNEWKRGSSSEIEVNVSPTNYNIVTGYTPTKILFRITKKATDSSAEEEEEKADPESSPPGYTPDPSNPTGPPILKQPGLGLEIPLGSVLTPQGYRSAGALRANGPVGSGFADPANFTYRGIDEAAGQVTAHSFMNGALLEKHYVAPSRVLRVRGWNSTTQSVVGLTGATETLLELYPLENYNASSHQFTGTPFSYYRLETATGGGLSAGFRIVKSEYGKTQTRTYQTGMLGCQLRETVGTRVVETVAVAPPSNSTTWQKQTIITEDGDIVSSIMETYALQGSRYDLVESTVDPSPVADDELTTYTSYYPDGRVKSVSKPDGSWSYHTYDDSYLGSATTYTPWLSSTVLSQASDGSWPLPGTGMAVKTVTSDGTTTSYLVDLSGESAPVIMSRIYGNESYQGVDRGDGNVVGRSSTYYPYDSTNRTEAGRVELSLDGTGSATRYEYHRGTMGASPSGTAAASFTADENGSIIREVRTTGYLAPYEEPEEGESPVLPVFTPVPSHSTREIIYTAPQGVVREETHVCDAGGNFQFALAKDHEYEAGGQRRHTGTKIKGIHISNTEYVSPLITREFDQEGTMTETELNGEGEVVRLSTSGSDSVPAVHTTISKIGLTTTTRVNGKILTVEKVDAAGRPVSHTDATGAEITTLYENGGRTVTQTFPGDDLHIIEEHHLDGKVISVTGGKVIPRSYSYSVDSDSGFVTTTTTVGTPPNIRTSSVTHYWDGSPAWEISADPAGGSVPIQRTYTYAATSSTAVRISSSAPNTADRIQNDPAVSGIAALGHYRLSGLGADLTILSTNHLTETSTSYVLSGGIWNRQIISKAFHTDNSDAAYIKTSLEALAPIPFAGGLRWTSSKSIGTNTVTTYRDSFFDESRSVSSTDDSATTLSPDSTTVSRHGRVVSSSVFGDTHPATMAYDAAGRISQTVSARGATATYHYSAVGQLDFVTDHEGKTTSYSYYSADHASAGLPWKTTNPENETVETLYNNWGQISETTGNGSYRVKYDYSGFGEKETMRTYRTEGSGGDLTTWTYYPETGFLHEKIDAAGQKVTYTYDSAGRLKTRLWARAGAVTTTYGYNTFGDLVLTDYSNNTTDVGDDTPDASGTFDRLGRPLSITDASGTRNHTYHPITGSPDLITYAGSGLLAAAQIDHTHDAALRPSGYSVSGGGPDATLVYDDAGRLGTVASSGDIYTHTYLPGTATLSSLTTATGSSQVLTRSLYHDRMQRLRGIATTNAGGIQLSRHGYTLDDAGRRETATRENGQKWTYGYDDIGQVTSAVKKFPDATAIPGHSFSYNYDGIGNRTSANHGGSGMEVTYTPNALNQYSSVSTEGGRFILGEAPTANSVTVNGTAASRAGGLGFYWRQITGVNATSPLWTTDTITSAGTTISGNTWTPRANFTPTYDLDGNLTADGRWIYTWDAENRLVRMETSSEAANAGVPRRRIDNVYDSQSRRVAKTISTSTNGSTWTFSSSLRYLYDGWNLIAEYNSPSATSSTRTLQSKFLWGIDVSGSAQGAGGVGGLLSATLITTSPTATTNYYPAYDGNGNVSAWINGSGVVISRKEYSPFGQIVAEYKFLSSDAATTSDRLRFGFSTKYTEAESGLLYYGYRYYDPTTGRWPSRDPIEEKGGVNLYGFVKNKPLDSIDKFGHETYTDAGSMTLWGLEGEITFKYKWDVSCENGQPQVNTPELTDFDIPGSNELGFKGGVTLGPLGIGGGVSVSRSGSISMKLYKIEPCQTNSSCYRVYVKINIDLVETSSLEGELGPATEPLWTKTSTTARYVQFKTVGCCAATGVTVSGGMQYQESGATLR